MMGQKRQFCLLHSNFILLKPYKIKSSTYLALYQNCNDKPDGMNFWLMRWTGWSRGTPFICPFLVQINIEWMFVSRVLKQYIGTKGDMVKVSFKNCAHSYTSYQEFIACVIFCAWKITRRERKRNLKILHTLLQISCKNSVWGGVLCKVLIMYTLKKNLP